MLNQFTGSLHSSHGEKRGHHSILFALKQTNVDQSRSYNNKKINTIFNYTFENNAYKELKASFSTVQFVF